MILQVEYPVFLYSVFELSPTDVANKPHKINSVRYIPSLNLGMYNTMQDNFQDKDPSTQRYSESQMDTSETSQS